MICFDFSFTDVGRRLSRQGAQVFIVPSLFGSTLTGYTHPHLVFQAVENRVTAVMSDIAFNPAIVDSNGHVIKLSMSPEGREEILVADIPLGPGLSIYARVGDWLGWLCFCSMMFSAAY
jgi:apolipoprotein N-acyltransferase